LIDKNSTVRKDFFWKFWDSKMSMLLKKTATFAMARRMASTGAHSHEGGMKLWKNMSLYLALPCVLVMSVYNFMHMAQEGEHAQPEFIPYDHLRIRNKRFPWGDGQKSLFHNPHMNPLPTGYEDHGDHH